MKCEAQIKTVLHDAWSAKTHDLTYKPFATLDLRMKRQMEVLGDTLAAIDVQSELLKSLIQEQWFIDKHRKDVAFQALMTMIREGEEDPERRITYEGLRADIIANAGKVLSGEERVKLLSDLTAQVEAFAEPTGWSYRNPCHLMALLGCLFNDGAIKERRNALH